MMSAPRTIRFMQNSRYMADRYVKTNGAILSCARMYCRWPFAWASSLPSEMILNIGSVLEGLRWTHPPANSGWSINSILRPSIVDIFWPENSFSMRGKQFPGRCLSRPVKAAFLHGVSGQLRDELGYCFSRVRPSSRGHTRCRQGCRGRGALPAK